VDKLTRTFQVPLSSVKAFNRFVSEVNKWWPKEYTWSQDDLKQISIDPRKDGLCTELGPFDFRCDWGRVTAIDENTSIDLKWQISPSRVPEPDPGKSSDIHIEFRNNLDSSTTVVFSHANFSRHGKGYEEYQKAMDSKEGWDYILEKYQEYCNAAE